MPRCLYVFLDEAGDFPVSIRGSRYYIIGSVAGERPFPFYPGLTELKYSLAEQGVDLDYFHASENAQAVRDRVFAIIQRDLADIRIDATIVEKIKLPSDLRAPEKLYPRMLGTHIGLVVKSFELQDYSKVLVYTDRIPIQREREAITKAIKQSLAQVLPAGMPFQLLHHDSKSNFQLQVADYCTWAIYRKWSREDARSYRLIEAAIRNEVEILQVTEK